MLAARPVACAQTSKTSDIYLYEKVDSTPISDALIIYNERSFITDSAGHFRLTAVFPCTIEYLHINHNGKIQLDDTSYQKIYVDTETHTLPEANIWFLKDKLGFDRAFVEGNIPIDSFLVLKGSLHLDAVDRSTHQGGIALGSPITMLYNQFSKEGQRKMAYTETMIKRQKVDILRIMMNRHRLSQVLETDDPEVMKCFFLYCSIHPDCVEFLSEAMLLRWLEDCEKTFDPNGNCDWSDMLYFVP
ncbi:MAG: hypothetical protein GC181_04005 [Bacteroidetes bacterium]|nr:hypothetical protein [Bacteroidota bacterium]